MSKNLRADITGLRAIAVLAVTLFHISHVLSPTQTYFLGGFLGVDIFFVISGFLMTMIIFTGIKSGRFSLWDFYKRRAKRICPALFAVVTVTFISCIILLRADPIHESFKEGLAALGFVSNFRFAKDLDYFDGGDFTHLFLHTWSLSVEWQFYIFYPLILICLKRFLGLRYLAPAMLIMTIVGVIVAVIWTNINARQSYFLLPSRACELLFGSLAYFYSVDSIKSNFTSKSVSALFNNYLKPQVLELIGIALIICSFVVIDNQHGWPTLWLLMPMIGTWLCIASNNNKSILRGMIFQKLGLWSYAIYLVHWPILVYVYALGLAEYSFLWLLPIIILGFILHELVEKRRSYGYKFTFLYVVAAGGFSLIDSSAIYRQYNISPYGAYEELASGNIINHQAVLVGDAPEFILHGDSYGLELVKPLISRDISFIFNNKDACYSIGTHVKNRQFGKKAAEHEKGCDLLYSKTKDLADHFESIPVLFVHNWDSFGDSSNPKSISNIDSFHIANEPDNLVPAVQYDEILVGDLNTLAKDFAGRTVYIIGRKQAHFSRSTGRSVNHEMINSSIIEKFNLYAKGPMTADLVEYRVNNLIQDTINDIQQRRSKGEHLADIRYIDPNVHCSGSKCNLFVNSIIPIYADGSHYSWAGAEKAVESILKTLGINKGEERVDFSKLPDIDFKSRQTVLEYSPDTGFVLPDGH